MKNKKGLRKKDVKYIASSLEKLRTDISSMVFLANEKMNDGQKLPEVQETEDYFQKKGREADITNTAFLNLIKRVELLENTLTEYGNEIEELYEELKRIKKKQKNMNEYLDILSNSIESLKKTVSKLEKHVRKNTEKIKQLFSSVINILILAGAGCNTKKSGVVLASNKLVRKKEKEHRRGQKLLGINDNTMRKE